MSARNIINWKPIFMISDFKIFPIMLLRQMNFGVFHVFYKRKTPLFLNLWFLLLLINRLSIKKCTLWINMDVLCQFKVQNRPTPFENSSHHISSIPLSIDSSVQLFPKKFFSFLSLIINKGVDVHFRVSMLRKRKRKPKRETKLTKKERKENQCNWEGDLKVNHKNGKEGALSKFISHEW